MSTHIKEFTQDKSDDAPENKHQVMGELEAVTPPTFGKLFAMPIMNTKSSLRDLDASQAVTEFMDVTTKPRAGMHQS